MPYTYHDNYIGVSDDTVLWRYIDHSKFESLINSSSLFFCRQDKFSDVYEGKGGQRRKEGREKAIS